jgi:glycerol-3-phosphate dehydrogenase
VRGLRTLLVDSHDFASGTSHLTSKVIHGGLRYLEHGHFRLVMEGIVERDRLLNQLAPNLVTPLRFVIPFEGRRFPKWLLTVSGLQLYGAVEWYHGGRRSSPFFGGRLREEYPTLREHPFAVSFWDAQTNDARLVMATLRTAEAEGATVRNYTSLRHVRFEEDGWTAELSSEGDAAHYTVRARSVVNATGPWAPVTTQLLGGDPMPLMWLKGSHILLRRPAGFGNDAIVIRSVRDLRLLWVIPWETRLIVGTTESNYTGDLRDVRPEADEIDDLFDSFARYFPRSGITRGDIRCAYAGVRPIVDQGGGSENSLSRKYEVVVDRPRRLITVNGGKLTTFRRMAEQTVDEVDRLLARRAADPHVRQRLRNAPLWPGLSRTDAARWIVELSAASNGSDESGRIASHLVRLYGRDAAAILKEAGRSAELGEPLFDDLECILQPLSPAGGSDEPTEGQTSRPRVRRADRGSDEPTEEGGSGRVREGPGGSEGRVRGFRNALLPYCLAELIYLCKSEQVCHLLDLVKRRTSIYFLADDGGQAVLPRIVDRVAPVLDWDAERRAWELSAVRDEFEADCRALNSRATLGESAVADFSPLSTVSGGQTSRPRREGPRVG